MGLRIIRPLPKRFGVISDAERQKELEQETKLWFEAKGETSAGAASDFIGHFHDVRARIDESVFSSDEQILEMASTVRRRILVRTSAHAVPHGQVDIATLLCLL